MELPSSSSSKKSRMDEQTLKTEHTMETKVSMAPSRFTVMAPKVYINLLPTSAVEPSTSTMVATMAASISTVAVSISKIKASSSSYILPSTPIPTEFDWTHSTITSNERKNFLDWVHSTAEMAAPVERIRLYKWADYIVETAAVGAPEEGERRFLKWAHSSSTMAAPDERKRRSLKWAHSTSTMAAPDERKRWSLQEEISKPFATAMKRIQEELKQNETALKHGYPIHKDSYTDLKQEYMIYTIGKHGVYECQNALWIWPRLRRSDTITLSQSLFDIGPRYVGEKIKEKFPETDMIDGRPSINDLGFVTINLSGKWIAKNIHKMLKDGIDTWAPKLPVDRVIVDYPSLNEEMHVDLFRQRAIGYTLMSILEYSKVDVTGHRMHDMDNERDDIFAQEVLNRWFSCEERERDVVIKGKVPFILPKRDFDNAYKDVLALWYGLCKQRADWIVYVTHVRKQEYIEMCFTAAKFEEWTPSDRHKPARTSYAGYRTCTTELEDISLDKAKTHCAAVEQGEAAKLLGYTAEAILDCVFMFTFLNNHRLAAWTFDIDEMLNEEGNTFVYLLNTQAKVRRITDDFREEINELKKAPELILDKDEDWEKGEERMLGFHLLEFTEALEECCLSVLPHILCEYLHDLSKKFNSYYSSVCKVGSVAETSTLLLCEATALVMEKCFHLLGITPTSSFFELSMTRRLFSDTKRPMDVKSRDPPRNSRFELLSFRAIALSQMERVEQGNLFGLISVSDKYGLISDRGSHFYQPDFAHVPLFNHDWCIPINTIDGELVYLGNSSSRHSVPFSSSIEIRMELYATKKKNTCYQLCNHKTEMDLADFWDKKSDCACGVLTVNGGDGPTIMNYILLKDAVDSVLEVKFRTKTGGRKVRGYVLAHYGDDFFYECQCHPSHRDDYMALLFLSNPRCVLKGGKIQLIKSVIAVPTKGSLIIKAYLEDVESEKMIMKNSYKFKSQVSSCSVGTISGVEGEDCHLDLKVTWKYQA